MKQILKTGEFNKAFGVKEHTTPQQNIIRDGPKTIEYRLSLITEEYKELIKAVEQNDYVETVTKKSRYNVCCIENNG